MTSRSLFSERMRGEKHQKMWIRRRKVETFLSNSLVETFRRISRYQKWSLSMIETNKCYHPNSCQTKKQSHRHETTESTTQLTTSFSLIQQRNWWYSDRDVWFTWRHQKPRGSSSSYEENLFPIFSGRKNGTRIDDRL